MKTNVRMVEAVEATDSVQQKEWLKRRTRFRRKLTEASLWLVGATAGAFMLPFIMGALVAYADPNGWPAWRIGLLVGGVTGIVTFVIGLLCAYVWISEQDL